jgi:hypothetical protein
MSSLEDMGHGGPKVRLFVDSQLRNVDPCTDGRPRPSACSYPHWKWSERWTTRTLHLTRLPSASWARSGSSERRFHLGFWCVVAFAPSHDKLSQQATSDEAWDPPARLVDPTQVLGRSEGFQIWRWCVCDPFRQFFPLPALPLSSDQQCNLPAIDNKGSVDVTLCHVGPFQGDTVLVLPICVQ